MEKELGFSLFTRSKAGVALTNYGERLLPYVNAVLNSDESLQQVIAEIEEFQNSGLGWAAASEVIVPKVMLLIGFYVLSIISITVESQMMAIITQGFLDRMRKTMFGGMQNLPIKYFDTHKHGDIMSYYTNDIDTLRMLVSQVMPTLIRAGVIVLSVFFIMIYYSIWMTLVLMVGVALMILVSKKVGGGAGNCSLGEEHCDFLKRKSY